MKSFTKQPSERFAFALEFLSRLPPVDGISISSAALSAIDTSNNSDTTAVVLQSTSGLVNGSQVLVPVMAGADAKVYKITVLTTLSDGSVLEDDVFMTVTAQ